MLQKGLKRPSSVVPYGTDLTLFYPADFSRLRTRLNLGTSLVIGYLGRLRKEKGLDTLIDALSLIVRRCPDLDCKVLFVGSGSEESVLREQVARVRLEDRVVFSGPILHDQAGDYLRCMDVFALPSRTRRPLPGKSIFGRVIIEARLAASRWSVRIAVKSLTLSGRQREAWYSRRAMRRSRQIV